MSFALTTSPLTRAVLLMACAAAISACGGGDDPLTPPGSGGGTGGGSTVAAAPLVVSAAAPASLNGTLAVSGALFESNSSNDVITTYAASDAYCRVAAYTLTNSGDGNKYYVELSFRKDTRAIGLVKFGDDTTFSVLASVTAPATGVVVDLTNRRIGFTNLVLTGSGATITLNGALDYPTNVDPSNQAACG